MTPSAPSSPATASPATAPAGMRPEAAGWQISTDPDAIPLRAVHALIACTYWARDIPWPVFERAARHSLLFAALTPAGECCGFARVISDRATFAYLCDVIVAEAFRGQGIAGALMQAVDTHPDLQGLRRQMLVTRDAHGLYEKFGFRALASPAQVMEKHRPDVYRRAAPDQLAEDTARTNGTEPIATNTIATSSSPTQSRAP